MECDFGTSSWWAGMLAGAIIALVAKQLWKEVNKWTQ